ncbi:MAG: siderophore-interacting protein, partial [Pseudonocardia sp.]
DDSVEKKRVDSPGSVTTHGLKRDGAAAGTTGQLLDAVRAAEFPAGQVFAWIAGESSAVRALRRHLVDDRGVEKCSIDFAGYWRLTLTQDDAPTDEDIAEAQERLAEAQAAGQGSWG